MNNNRMSTMRTLKKQYDEPNFLYKCGQISRNGLYPSIARIDAVSNIPVHVRFENDASTIWYGFGRLLGEALLVNTIVDRIDLLLDPYLFYTAGATSDGKIQEAAPMLQYLRTRSSVRNIRWTLSAEYFEDEWNNYYPMEPALPLLGQMLQSIAQNANITTSVCGVELPWDALALFLLSTTQTVKSIRLEKYAMNGFMNATSNLVADIFGANQSIQQLSRETVEQIVHRLDARCVSMPTAYITNVTVQVNQPALLDDLLLSTAVLKTLELDWIEFEEDDSRRIERISDQVVIENCKFNQQATTALMDFVQTKVNQGGNKIKTLHFDANERSAVVGTVPFLINGSTSHSLGDRGWF
jgi:hypothetical protein